MSHHRPARRTITRTALAAAALASSFAAFGSSSPAAAAGCTISSPVSAKQTSAAVNCVERTLQAKGYQSTYIDNFYGTVTVSSVARFQAANGLPVNGNVVDYATATALGIWAAAPAPTPAPAAGCGITASVSAKQTSAAVNCVERTLQAKGYQSTYIDNFYGTVTATAVARFQSANGLPVNGNVVDYATATALGIWQGPPPPPPPAQPQGCLQYPVAPDADGVFVINPGKYQRVAATSEVGAKGPIIVVGDSLTWASAKQTAVALRSAGWGPVCVDGTISRTVEFGNAEVPDGLDAVARIKASNTLWAQPSVKWVVALGTNDVGFSTSSGIRAATYIADQLASIGSSRQVSWMPVRTRRSGSWPSREAIWNTALTNSGVQVMPWAAEFQSAWVGGDLVHCTTAGNAARAAMYGRLS